MDPPYLVELDSARSFVIGLVELNDGSRAEEVAMCIGRSRGWNGTKEEKENIRRKRQDREREKRERI